MPETGEGTVKQVYADSGAPSMAMSSSIQKLAGALIAAQTALPKLSKDKENPFFRSKYAGLDTVLPAALKVLTDHGLGMVQTVGQTQDGGTTLTTLLMHESGEWLRDTQPLLLTKADPQGQGSAITYARRYAVMSLLGLVADEDDDGNAASKPPQQRTYAPPRPVGQARPTPVQAASTNAQGITDNQMKAIRASLSDIFGKDERAQCEFMAATMPVALNESQTEIHLSPLSSAEARQVIMALNERRAQRRGQEPPEEEP